jgi:hypothetical protein
MTNPYASPHSPEPQPGREQTAATLSGPAIGLLVVSIISVVLLILTTLFDIFLLASGTAAHMPASGDQTATVLIRTTWGVAILLASAYCAFGALQMKNLKSFDQARTAAIVACIPCLGPCCLLGIPFGAWALTILGRPEVRSHFES